MSEKRPIGPAIWKSPALLGSSLERDGNRHHTRAAVISHPDNTSHPANRKQPATYHTPRAHSFVSIATGRLSASQRLPEDVVSGGVWTSGRQSYVRRTCGDGFSCIYILGKQPCAFMQTQRPVHTIVICSDEQEGRRPSEGSEADVSLYKIKSALKRIGSNVARGGKLQSRFLLLYCCSQKFTCTHHGHDCCGNLGVFNDFFELLFFQGGMIAQHLSWMTLKSKNWEHKFEFTLFSIYTHPLIFG